MARAIAIAWRMVLIALVLILAAGFLLQFEWAVTT